ncbi:MAG: LTA synthase family protein [Bacteroidales bacterium]
MQNIFNKLKIILLQLLLLLILYQITRLLFYIFNYSYFNQNDITDILIAFLWGTRFDLWVILIFNIPFIIWALLPINFSIYKTFHIYFVFTNSFLLLFNLIDIAYFDFTLKRSTADLFNLINTGNDVWVLLPRFIIDFWYIVLFFVIIILILYKAYLWIPKPSLTSFNYTFKNITYLVLTWLIIFSLIFSNIRGTRLRPVSLLSASLYAKPNLLPLVLNTPFSILKTFGKPIPIIHQYFNNPEKYFSTNYIVPLNHKTYPQKNVVLIILESFSKEHIGFFTPQNKGYTPFLDSLLSKSLVISNSFANGRKSLESLPSLLTSLPSLMDIPYILSPFSSNTIKSLPQVLANHGYYTSFYHGGTNGTMGFDVFSSMTGIKDYFGRWQYPNSNDYDGNWGIWDEPYLQYVKKQFDQQPTPFFSIIYTLSSHHPYKVPDKYKNILPKGNHEILQSIAYTDLSLKAFFKEAQKSPWFNNTLFIITADHVFGAHSDFYYNKIGSYSVPIAFYMPSDTTFKGVLKTTAQHADIYPSILGLLGIKDTIYAFGRSIWDTSSIHFAVNYLNGEYHLIMNNYLLCFDGNNTIGLYHCKNDSLLNNNLIKSSIKEKEIMENILKAIIQQYDNDLIYNHLTPSIR